jgi:hypothetical protein
MPTRAAPGTAIRRVAAVIQAIRGRLSGIGYLRERV